MPVRNMIEIDKEKCNGCGLCVPNCPEGALQMIEGKARLISDIFCDGLGACIGECPEGAIKIVEREAIAYDEVKVMETIMKQGEKVIKAHLKHLKEHNQDEYYNQAIEFLKSNGFDIASLISIEKNGACEHSNPQMSCPGAKSMDLKPLEGLEDSEVHLKSQLSQWPIQLHLVSPDQPYFKEADLLIVADCVAYASANFHSQYLKGKRLVIACPKLDEGQTEYLEKLKNFIVNARVNTITVMIMEVPCCRGLLNLVQQAISQAKSKVPLKLIVVGIKGDILKSEWVGM